MQVKISFNFSSHLLLDVSNLPVVGEAKEGEGWNQRGDDEKKKVHHPFLQTILQSENFGSPDLDEEGGEA